MKVSDYQNRIMPVDLVQSLVYLHNSEVGEQIIFFVFTPSVLAPYATVMLTYLLFYFILFVYLNF